MRIGDAEIDLADSEADRIARMTIEYAVNPGYLIHGSLRWRERARSLRDGTPADLADLAAGAFSDIDIRVTALKAVAR